MKILISEHQEIFRAGIIKILKDEGHDVNFSETATIFNEMVSWDYDVIIMDMEMLGQLAVKLADDSYNHINQYCSHIPKLIATYNNAYNYTKPYLFDAFLSKPFNKEKLLNTINKEYSHVRRLNSKTNFRNIRDIYDSSMV